ncbi:MAG: HypC/HybG/HupF family hydrogenase formation chaperone [Micrococcales bacterium]|nr:HypC/HybG/HupF family hydrogenase formation chaperone [Micrococcales bacterium]
MCLSIPARIVEIVGGAMPMAQVDVAGRTESCCLSYLPDAAVGDYVLVQHGFAVELLDPQSAAESLAAFVALGLVPSSAESGPVVPEIEGLGQVRYAQATGAAPAAPDQG